MEPTPELCCQILARMELVLPIYIKFVSLIDISLYAYHVLYCGNEMHLIRSENDDVAITLFLLTRVLDVSDLTVIRARTYSI